MVELYSVLGTFGGGEDSGGYWNGLDEGLYGT